MLEDEDVEVGGFDELEAAERAAPSRGGKRELGPHPQVQTFVHFPDYNDSRAFRQGEDVVVW